MAAGTEPPTPGTPNYIPSLVRYLSQCPELRGWAPDGTLLAIWLMTLQNRDHDGGGGGLILDVDVRSSRRPGGAVAKAARYAVSMCEGIFGMPTRMLNLSEGSYTAGVSVDRAAVVVTGLENASAPVAIKIARDAARTGALLVWVRDEDDDGAPGWLLDQFACSVRTSTLPPLSSPSALGIHPLLSPSYVADLRSLMVPTHVGPALDLYTSNLISALALHPHLKSELSRRATASFAAFIRAHCVLTSELDLPPDWSRIAAAWKSREGRTATALTAAQGGMGNWASKAGERPKPRSVFGPGVRDWYARPENARAVFAIVMRHRCRVRGEGEGEGMLYALRGSAEERVAATNKEAEEREEGEGSEREVGERRARRRRREEVEDALGDVLAEV